MVTVDDSGYKASIIYLCRDLKTEEDSEEVQSDRDILLQLLSVPDLPPSLLPPPPGGWTRQENTEWGWKNIHFLTEHESNSILLRIVLEGTIFPPFCLKAVDSRMDYCCTVPILSLELFNVSNDRKVFFLTVNYAPWMWHLRRGSFDVRVPTGNEIFAEQMEAIFCFILMMRCFIRQIAYLVESYFLLGCKKMTYLLD